MAILTTAQADAVADAMCALNNIGGRLHCRIAMGEFDVLHIAEYENGEIRVYFGDAIGNPIGQGSERYDTQTEFVEAYGV